MTAGPHNPPLDENKVWIDGCFDFTHHGHAGAILQARRTILPGPDNDYGRAGKVICGVHSDEAIAFNKGPTVMTSRERYEHTRSNRWCSEVVEDAPYVTQPEWMDRYGCKYVVHGDDITLDANGQDCYQIMKDLGRFKVVARTTGVSTTDIIHRILTGVYQQPGVDHFARPDLKTLKLFCTAADGYTEHCWVFEGNMSKVLVQGNKHLVESGNKKVLVVGGFDLFHMGHIDQLRRINKELYPEEDCRVIIGLTRYNSKDGSDLTIMSLKERLLSVLSCKYVDGVIVEPDLDDKDGFHAVYEVDCDTLAKGGEFSGYLTRELIISRIKHNSELYKSRNQKKGMSYS